MNTYEYLLKCWHDYKVTSIDFVALMYWDSKRKSTAPLSGLECDAR